MFKKKDSVSHNACCDKFVEFAGRKYRLPRFFIGSQVLYHSRPCIVNGIFCPRSGSVIYQIDPSDGSLPFEAYEHEVSFMAKPSNASSFCGFRLGDTVVDTSALGQFVSEVVAFDYNRCCIKIRERRNNYCYLVSPADLRFVDPFTLVVSDKRPNTNTKKNERINHA